MANKSLARENFYQAVNEFYRPIFLLKNNQLLKDSRIKVDNVSFKESDLLFVLKNTRNYFLKFSEEDPVVKRIGFLQNYGISQTEIIKTINFMIRTIEEDRQLQRKSRLHDPNFINKNFRILHWSPDKIHKNQPSGKIRITKYAIFTHSGSKIKTKKYQFALYGLDDIEGKKELARKYTKQQIVTGIYEKGGEMSGKAKALVYLSREALEEALMEGTILIKFTDGSSAYYNVDINNGYSYLKGVKAEKQKRYWYFKKVNSINGYGAKIENRIKVKAGVTFAGDVLNVGLGRIIGIESESKKQKTLKLGVIADTGGAFLPNLGQLDFLSGIYKNRKAFQNDQKNLPPEYAKTYILIKK